MGRAQCSPTYMGGTLVETRYVYFGHQFIILIVVTSMRLCLRSPGFFSNTGWGNPESKNSRLDSATSLGQVTT